MTFEPEVRKRVKIVHHDLKAELNPLIRSDIGEVDAVLHLAAGSHVDRSIDYPMEFVLDNVVGTCNILEFARTCKNLQKFIYFSTDEISDQHLTESSIRRTIDTIQLIHIVQQRQGEKN